MAQVKFQMPRIASLRSARIPRGPALAIGLAVAAAGCAQFPQIDAFPAGGSTQSPELLPIDPLLAQASAPQVAAAAGDALAARAARLRARAALMRGPILDPDTRARLTAAIQAGRA